MPPTSVPPTSVPGSGMPSTGVPGSGTSVSATGPPFIARTLALVAVLGILCGAPGAAAGYEELFPPALQDDPSLTRQLSEHTLRASLADTLAALPPAQIRPRWEDVDRREAWMYELLRDLYRDRRGAPIFVRGTTLTRAAYDLLDAIARVDEHGIPPERFVHAELRELYTIVTRPIEDPDLFAAFLPPPVVSDQLEQDVAARLTDDPYAVLAPERALADAVTTLDRHFVDVAAQHAAFLANEFDRKMAAAAELELLLAEQLVRYAMELRYANPWGAPDNPAMTVARNFLMERGFGENDETPAALQAAMFPAQHSGDLRSVDEWRLDELDMLLAAAAGQLGLAEALDALAPQVDEYRGLQRELQRYRAIARAGSWPRVTMRGRLLPGQRHPAVEVLRVRLSREGYHDAPAPADAQLFDEALGASLARWKRDHQLEDSPALDEMTRDALAVPVEERIAQLTVALASWRRTRAAWDIERGNTHIRVNIPQFQAELRDGDELVHRWDVVVGRVRGAGLNFTESFSALMTEIELNPFWYPPTRLVRNAFTLNERGRYYMAPGPSNPMGRAKFLFPNPWAIYMHDTNRRADFALPFRSLSAGCVRVDGAEQLAALLIGRDRGQDTEQADAWVQQVLAGGRRQRVYLRTPVPVHIEYRTAWLGPDGRARFGTDLYGWEQRSVDAAVRETLARFPNLVPERPGDRRSRQARLARRKD